MAGHRRGTGKPTQRQAGADRRRQALTAAMAQASGPVERLSIAAEYLRGALRRNPAPEALNEAENLAQQLIAAGHRINEGAR